jgi:hypothetical protein
MIISVASRTELYFGSHWGFVELKCGLGVTGCNTSLVDGYHCFGGSYPLHIQDKTILSVSFNFQLLILSMVITHVYFIDICYFSFLT